MVETEHKYVRLDLPARLPGQQEILLDPTINLLKIQVEVASERSPIERHILLLENKKHNNRLIKHNKQDNVTTSIAPEHQDAPS